MNSQPFHGPIFTFFCSLDLHASVQRIVLKGTKYHSRFEIFFQKKQERAMKRKALHEEAEEAFKRMKPGPKRAQREWTGLEKAQFKVQTLRVCKDQGSMSGLTQEEADDLLLRIMDALLNHEEDTGEAICFEDPKRLM